MHFERGESRGLPIYSTLRGTSQLERYHRWLRACISGSRVCPELFAEELLAHFNFRWNVRCGIRSRGDVDQGTYARHVLQAVYDRSRDRALGDLIPGLYSAMTVDDAAAKGIDLPAIGFHMPGTSVKMDAAADMIDDT